MSLISKTAFMTGGLGGIGRAICARSSKKDATVVTIDSEKVDERSGHLDTLVSTASIEIEKTFEETSSEEWRYKP